MYYCNFQNSRLKILDVKTIAKLKIVALLQREKSRDLFDFGSMCEHQILSLDEILELTNKIKNINTKEDLIEFIKLKQEPKDDEAVYLDETNRLDLSFDEIKKQVLLQLKNC